MKKYESNVLFQITACFALAHLFFNFAIKDEIVEKSNGIKIILNVMKRNPLNESLQTTAIFALGSIVMKNGNPFLLKCNSHTHEIECHRIAAYKENGIKLIINAMRTNFYQNQQRESNSSSSSTDSETKNAQSHSDCKIYFLVI